MDSNTLGLNKLALECVIIVCILEGIDGAIDKSSSWTNICKVLGREGGWTNICKILDRKGRTSSRVATNKE